MRRYGQLQSTFWTHPDTVDMSDGAKLLAVYLLTSPHTNGLGCFRLPAGYVTSDLGWTQETVSKRLGELLAKGFLRVCIDTDFVLIKGFIKWNPIVNANVARARLDEYESIPKKFQYFNELIDELKRFGNHLPNGFETITQTVSKQEPDPDPDPEPNIHIVKHNPRPVSKRVSKRAANGADDAGFNPWWLQWPRKVNKQHARKAWAKLSTEDRAAATAALTNWPFPENPQFCPHPGSWLNGRRWEDEPDPPPADDSPQHWISDEDAP